MRTMTWVASFFLVASGVDGQQMEPPPSTGSIPIEVVKGRSAQMLLQGNTIEAELLAVGLDSVWVDQGGLTVGFPLSEVDRVRVRRHNWSAGRMLAWNLVAGLGSGLALYSACQSVSGTDSCGGFFLGWSLTWAVIGGFSGASVARSSRETVPPTANGLRRFVRFPQGLPESYRDGRR